MKRAADKDVHGRRKLPFFIDPIDGKLKIQKMCAHLIYGCQYRSMHKRIVSYCLCCIVDNCLK